MASKLLSSHPCFRKRFHLCLVLVLWWRKESLKNDRKSLFSSDQPRLSRGCDFCLGAHSSPLSCDSLGFWQSVESDVFEFSTYLFIHFGLGEIVTEA